jgi:hypothetical protein
MGLSAQQCGEEGYAVPEEQWAINHFNRAVYRLFDWIYLYWLCRK